MKKFKLTAWMLVVLISAGTFLSGCGKEKKVQTSSSLPSKINELGNSIADIDDLPDWDGKQLDLVYWYCQGTAAPAIGKKAKNDVVRDELKRVSGISFDESNSFDNNGENGDSKIAKIIASNSWPDVAYNLDKNLVEKLLKADKIFDLTQAIPDYMTNYMKIVNSDDISKKEFENLKVNNKMWYFTQTSAGAAPYVDDEYSQEKYASLITPEETRAWMWVRDDILTTLYPNAKTQAQIKEQYMKDGHFSKEDMRDVVISNNDDLMDLLVKIDSLQVTENGRKVWPFYTHNGTDNWDILTVFNSMVGAGSQSTVNYFAYYDNSQKKIVRTADQEWFKNQMKFYNNLINLGLSSKESLVDNKAAFEQKKNNGEYAVIYGNTAPPTDEALKAAGKAYSYRKVLIDIPMDHTRFIKQNTEGKVLDGARFTFFKNTNIKTETDLEQVLRFFDFFHTQAGMKFSYWGPKKSGLFTETNGELSFADEKLEEDSVYNGNNDTRIQYGFSSWPSIFDFAVYASPYNPKVVYSKNGIRKPGQYTTAFRYSTVDPAPKYPDLKVNFSIWNWTQYVENLKKFWDARQASEDAFKLIFTAKNEDEFEKNYNDMIGVLNRNGLTQETIDEWNQKFLEVNKDYIDGLKNWKPQK